MLGLNAPLHGVTFLHSGCCVRSQESTQFRDKKEPTGRGAVLLDQAVGHGVVSEIAIAGKFELL